MADIVVEEKSKDDNKRKEFWDRVNLREIRSISYD